MPFWLKCGCVQLRGSKFCWGSANLVRVPLLWRSWALRVFPLGVVQAETPGGLSGWTPARLRAIRASAGIGRLCLSVLHSKQSSSGLAASVLTCLSAEWLRPLTFSVTCSRAPFPGFCCQLRRAPGFSCALVPRLGSVWLAVATGSTRAPDSSCSCLLDQSAV